MTFLNFFQKSISYFFLKNFIRKMGKVDSIIFLPNENVIVWEMKTLTSAYSLPSASLYTQLCGDVLRLRGPRGGDVTLAMWIWSWGRGPMLAQLATRCRCRRSHGVLVPLAAPLAVPLPGQPWPRHCWGCGGPCSTPGSAPGRAPGMPTPTSGGSASTDSDSPTALGSLTPFALRRRCAAMVARSVLRFCGKNSSKGSSEAVIRGRDSRALATTCDGEVAPSLAYALQPASGFRVALRINR